MKLVKFIHHQGYWFTLLFENGESKESDLSALIGNYVSPDNLDTARVNSEWGCLEFNNGMVDIDPNTLYCHAVSKPKANSY
jgi:hypothetical protein